MKVNLSQCSLSNLAIGVEGEELSKLEAKNMEPLPLDCDSASIGPQFKMTDPSDRALLSSETSALEVAEQIKPMDASLNRWIQEAPDGEQRMRTVAKIMIENCARNRSTLLKLSSCQLSSLPDCIGMLTHLKKLKLNNNKLQQLPDAIIALTELTALDVADNCLQQVPKQISQLQSLQVLEMMNNELKEIPDTIHHLQQLTRLDISRNRIKHLPDVFHNMENLSELNCGYNQLSDLPPLLLAREIPLHLDFKCNLMMPDRVLQLAKMANETDYIGPDFGLDGLELSSWFMMYGIINTELNLQDNLDFWLGYEGAHLEHVWASEKCLGVANANLFLNSLRIVEDFQIPKYRVTLTRKVQELLQQIKTDNSFRELFFGMADVAVSDCQDGVALGFDDIYLSMLIHRHSTDRPSKQLLLLGRDHLLLSSIKKIAECRAVEIDSNDPLEVYLAYQVGLKDLFSILEVEQNMVFGAISGIDQVDIDSARLQLDADMVPETVREFIVNWAPWQKACQAEGAVKAVNLKFNALIDQLYDTKQTLTWDTYLQKNEALIVAR